MEHSVAVMVFRGENRICHPGSFCHSGKFLGIKVRWIEGRCYAIILLNSEVLTVGPVQVYNSIYQRPQKLPAILARRSPAYEHTETGSIKPCARFKSPFSHSLFYQEHVATLLVHKYIISAARVLRFRALDWFAYQYTTAYHLFSIISILTIKKLYWAYGCRSTHQIMDKPYSRQFESIRSCSSAREVM